MNTQAEMHLHLPLLSAGTALLLLGGIAIASLAITAQGFDDAFAPPDPGKTSVLRTAAAADVSKCAECGVIESTQKIEASSANAAAGGRGGVESGPGGSYVITIRLKDGTKRTITDAHAARWRAGERVTLISGVQ